MTNGNQHTRNQFLLRSPKAVKSSLTGIGEAVDELESRDWSWSYIDNVMTVTEEDMPWPSKCQRVGMGEESYHGGLDKPVTGT